MSLARHHKGMKIAASLAFFVGEGLQTRPDKALPCPYYFQRRSYRRGPKLRLKSETTPAIWSGADSAFRSFCRMSLSRKL